MKKVKTHFWILTLIYAVILVWGILLKMNRLRAIERNFAYMIKLDLFSRLTYSLNPFSMHATTVRENVLNVIAFMPFGFLSAAAVRKGALLKASAASLLLSLLFETIQIFTAIGGFSTADLIGNTLGGLLGACALVAVSFCLGRMREKPRRILTWAFILLAYALLTPAALYGVGNTLFHLEFYIGLYR